ncbi:MAG: phosphopantetheine-binding protein, partial [Pyrinomonadaceae bacterium]
VGGRIGARQASVAGMREEAAAAGEGEVVGGGGGEWRGGERLRGELGRRLPEYMVPVEIVRVGELPLTANGKLDRKALASFELNPERLRSIEYVPPRTPLEEQLASIWAETLGVERVGVYDNFFELGGDSLLAVRTATRVNETFQIDLPLQDFIKSQTVDGITKLIIETLRKQIEALTDEEVEALMVTSDETTSD